VSVRVTRSRRPATWSGLASALVFVALLSLPYLVFANVTSLLVNLFILLVLATMWNLLAGYAGLVSVGQQAYLGLGAYTVLVLAQNGVNPFLAIPVAIAFCAVAALPISLLVFRLRNEYFAIGTWVVAEAFQLITVRFPQLGGGTGASLPGLGGFDPALRQAFTYWAALAVLAATLLAAYLLLRSRLGLDLTAIRDDEVGARSVGVQPARAKRIVYLIAAAGAGGAGALIIISQLNVQAASVFSVQWSAYMIFVAVIGGVGTDPGHDPLLQPPAVAGGARRLVPDHRRDGRGAGGDVRAAGPLGRDQRPLRPAPVSDRLLAAPTRLIAGGPAGPPASTRALNCRISTKTGCLQRCKWHELDKTPPVNVHCAGRSWG